MNNTKETFVFGFALFAGFFGAGNLILPPLLGFNSGPDWWLVTLGFVISATIIPLISLFAHARLQGTMLAFGNKVSPLFSLFFVLCVFPIVIALPCPRTAAVTHEMVIHPFFGTSAILTSSIFFALAFIFVINRNNALNILGKYLTPIIVAILILIIVLGIISPVPEMNPSIYSTPIVEGLLEGYQTYDAIAGMLMGGMVIISINNSKVNMSFEDKKKMIAKSGFIAMCGLFIVYAGLIALGALYNSEFDSGISRTNLLLGLASKTLGNYGAISLGILVSLACFTTAVAIIVSTADFFKELFKGSEKAYLLTTIICCVVGIIVGSYNVGFIIDIALPALMFIYPISIVLIILNVVPERFGTTLVFKSVVLVTFIFSIPDFLKFIIPIENIQGIINIIPLAKHSLGWVLPAIVTFILVNLLEHKEA
ncbi:branched-chain amino acid transport system carrier protein [Aquaticitalea lipolytica]|uniref:Branched-chain amino acid transport system carrier protein n=1 Tax=Aquaticitalea lipolytica TaxID=1247562 RepID=A0A8J2TTF2_9FLAO|nr:branched-chain amino acid transport system II carrier protein [Aquaticitalea lipolytica]GFZ89504.1 branched-chain amino acid transport system carrier protein [Aquaticitalea lipolytica]